MFIRVVVALRSHFPELKTSEYAGLIASIYKFNKICTLEYLYKMHDENGNEYTIEDGIIHLVNY